VAALARDDRRHPAFLQPPEQPPQLRAEDARVRQAAEERFHRVEHDPLRLDGPNRVVQPDEHRLEIVFTGLLDLGALDANVFDRDASGLDQPIEVVPERAHVERQVLRPLFERDEYARLAESNGAVHDEFEAEQRLATAGSAGDERGPAARQAAARDVVEAADARGYLGKRVWGRASSAGARCRA